MELHKITLIAGKLDKLTPAFTIYIILKEDSISELKSWLGYIFTPYEAVFQQLCPPQYQDLCNLISKI